VPGNITTCPLVYLTDPNGTVVYRFSKYECVFYYHKKRLDLSFTSGFSTTPDGATWQYSWNGGAEFPAIKGLYTMSVVSRDSTYENILFDSGPLATFTLQ
jgi:hypothetical protein